LSHRAVTALMAADAPKRPLMLPADSGH
jgi:hypothetical protein